MRFISNKTKIRSLVQQSPLHFYEKIFTTGTVTLLVNLKCGELQLIFKLKVFLIQTLKSGSAHFLKEPMTYKFPESVSIIFP